MLSGPRLPRRVFDRHAERDSVRRYLSEAELVVTRTRTRHATN